MPHRSLILLLVSAIILAAALGWNDPLDAQRQQGAPRPGFPTAPPRDRPALATHAVSVAEPDGMADDFGRKAMPMVAGPASVHPGIVPGGELT